MDRINGVITKSLSGFYYVQAESRGVIECRARGKIRSGKELPLSGDQVIISLTGNDKGTIEEVLPRKNAFIRPAVANVDTMVFVAANTNPITDPFLLDKVSVIAVNAGCRFVICINKTDLDPADVLYSTYSNAGFDVIRTSAETGEGISQLMDTLKGQKCVFTGNSGVGKSSLLNYIIPGVNIAVNEVSEKLGRGKHTTRHVEFYDAGSETFIADTPGFASYEIEMIQSILPEQLQNCFPDFEPFLGKCRFDDCIHLKEPDCCVRGAVGEKRIALSRYESYSKLMERLQLVKSWETT